MIPNSQLVADVNSARPFLFSAGKYGGRSHHDLWQQILYDFD